MKQRLVITLVFGILVAMTGFSQSITHAEYYFDRDPGIGEGIPITVNTPLESVADSFDIILSDTLEEGYHWLYIRSRDDEGKWGLAQGHKIYIYEDANPSTVVDRPDIAGVEYYIDSEPGVGMGTWIANSSIKDTIEETLEIAVAGLSPGYHRLYTRARDTEGRWGIPDFRKFYVFEDTVVLTTKTTAPIVAAEYYFDDEVPFGQGTPLPVSKGDSVEWSGTIDVTGLEPGDHHLLIRVRDSVGRWGIAYSKAFSVVGLTTTLEPPVICQGSSDGTATVSITGGKPPFTFLWDDPDQQSDSTAVGLSAGFYTVTVQDSEGAVIKETVEIREYDTIGISITTSDTDCKLYQGSATAVATGDNPPFKYLWTNGSDEQSASGLKSGIYEVTVTDNIGCQNKAVATINDIGGPQITATDAQIQHLECAGDDNGIIAPVISGGTPPYEYSWSNGETTSALQNLTAGSYELTVKDADGCIASKSIRVEEPQPITYTLSVNSAGCGSEDGSATLSVIGGSQPYFYNWKGEDPPHNATRTGLGAGVYEVTITDNEGCSATAQIAVGEDGAASVNVTAITQTTCGNTDGSILISVAGGTGSYDYIWKNEAGAIVREDVKDLVGVGSGIYNVEVSDGSGCKAFASATIPAELPPTEMICLVTVDSLTGRNLIAWDKTPGHGIVAYRLYRETSSAGVFDSIAWIPVDSLSSYTDDYADPVIRSWRYKLAAINSCGVESRLSPPHKTMHLTLNVGLLNHVNLIWNHYEGYLPEANNYKIWRHSGSTGWQMIDVVPANLNSYTDDDGLDADLWYYVEAVHPTGCTPLKASTLNSSKSNRKNKLKEAPEGVNSFSQDYKLLVYPNPSDGLFKLMMEVDGVEDLEIKVFDLSGKLVHLEELHRVSSKLEHDIDLSRYAKGMYHLHLKTDKGKYDQILVIQ